MAGVGTTAVGSVGVVASIYVLRGDLNWVRVMGSLGMLAVIVGVVMGGVSLLALKGRSIEEAYSLGYDVGFEKGMLTGQRTLIHACPLPKATCTLKSTGPPDVSEESIAAALEEVDG